MEMPSRPNISQYFDIFPNIFENAHKNIENKRKILKIFKMCPKIQKMCPKYFENFECAQNFVLQKI
jgi:hypothetical protein